MRKYILKIDLDVRMPKRWFSLWQKSRYGLLESIGFKVERIISKKSSKRGTHNWIWIQSDKELQSTDLNRLQMLCGDDWGRVFINAGRIKKGIPWRKGNKMFGKVLWKSKHICNCKLHQKSILKQKEGQKAFLKEGI